MMRVSRDSLFLLKLFAEPGTVCPSQRLTNTSIRALKAGIVVFGLSATLLQRNRKRYKAFHVLNVVRLRDTQWDWVITFFERSASSSRAGNPANESDDFQ